MNRWAKRIIIFYTTLMVTHGAFAAILLGATDYLSVPDSTSLNVTGTALTLNAWVNKLTPVAGSWVISKNNSGSTIGYGMRSNTNTTVRFSLAVTGVSKNLNGTTTGVWDGNWHMVTMTYDGTNMRAYTDAIEDASSPFAAAGTITSSSGQALNIGRNSGSPGSPIFAGKVDDILISTQVLTVAQITSLFLSRQKMIITPCGGHWRFDEGSVGATVVGFAFNDICGNGNTLTGGTNVGATLQMTPSILNYP